MKNKEFNILLLTDGMMPGGVERHVVHLANGLNKKGITVTVAATDGPFRNLLNPSIPFLTLPLLSTETSRKRPLGLLRSISLLKKYIQGNQISIIHSHKRYTDFIARIAASVSKKTIHISTCHNSFNNLTWLPSFGYYTIACSNNVAAMLIQVFGKSDQSVRTIYNGVPELSEYSTEQKTRIKEQFGIPARTRIICSIGSLIKEKNPEALLQAFVNLRADQTMTDVHLVIVGDGDRKEFVEEYIDRCALQKSVTLLPAETPVEEVFNIAEFCILSSVREGFPLVLLEAASIGKPYIATDVGGVAEFIDYNKNGFLVPPNDSSALTKAISYLLNNPASVRMFGENARRKYQQNFTLNRMINETIEVYESMLKMKDVKA
jgi:glycosyltransferase involved in cell wall biosynthesis